MYTVLIADDEFIERKYLRKIFEKHSDSFRIVGEALNGKEAVDKSRHFAPDIIILDINMPSINGLEAAKIIKDFLPRSTIILNTAYAEFEFARLALEYRLDGYLLKPSKEDEILKCIQKCTNRMRPSPSLPVKNEDGVEKVKAKIEEEYMQNLSLNTLSSFVHFSPSYLSTIFHRQTGMTITEYVRKVRISHAIDMLENSADSVCEIAKKCGFSNIPHFNRVFKKYTGNSPIELRKKMNIYETY